MNKTINFNIRKISKILVLDEKAQITIISKRICKEKIKKEFLELYPLANIKKITSLNTTDNTKKFYIKIVNYSAIKDLLN